MIRFFKFLMITGLLFVVIFACHREELVTEIIPDSEQVSFDEAKKFFEEQKSNLKNKFTLLPEWETFKQGGINNNNKPFAYVKIYVNDYTSADTELFFVKTEKGFESNIIFKKKSGKKFSKQMLIFSFCGTLEEVCYVDKNGELKGGIVKNNALTSKKGKGNTNSDILHFLNETDSGIYDEDAIQLEPVVVWGDRKQIYISPHHNSFFNNYRETPYMNSNWYGSSDYGNQGGGGGSAPKKKDDIMNFSSWLSSDDIELLKQQSDETKTELISYLAGGDITQKRQFVKKALHYMKDDNSLTFKQAMALSILDGSFDPITGKSISLYLILQYKNPEYFKTASFSVGSNSINVGQYTLTPHYSPSNKLVFYTAARYLGNKLKYNIEFVIKPEALNDFKSKIDLYTASANVFYLNGIPSEGQIALAAGDYIEGLTKMWGEALQNPQYYVYLAHIMVATSTNLTAVNSTSNLKNGKISYTFITESQARYSNIKINNYTHAEYMEMIARKHNMQWKTVYAEGNKWVKVIENKNIRYNARNFAKNQEYPLTIDVVKNDKMLGKLRFED